MIKNRRIVLTEFAISFVLSVAGIFLIPAVFYRFSGSAGAGMVWGLIAGAILVGIFVLLFSALLRSLLISESFMDSLAKMTTAYLIFAGCFLIFGFLAGLLAVAVYKLFKTTFAFEQIKAIVDYAVTIILVFIIPFFISVFWSELKGKSGFTVNFKSGLKVTRKRYFKFFSMVIALFLVGFVLTALFNFLPVNIFIGILKALVLSIPGTVVLFMSEKIAEDEKEEKMV